MHNEHNDFTTKQEKKLTSLGDAILSNFYILLYKWNLVKKGIRVVGHLLLGPVKGVVLKVFHLYPHYPRELFCPDWSRGSLNVFDYPTKLQSTKEDPEAAVA